MTKSYMDGLPLERKIHRTACGSGVTPKPSCLKPFFDQTFEVKVKKWLPNLVSESQIVQWLGRYREGVPTHRSDPSTKNTSRQLRVDRCIVRETKTHSAPVL